MRGKHVKTLEEVKHILQQNADILQSKWGVANLAVFGSIIRSEQKESSDIDIIADVPEDMSLLGVVSIRNYLSELLDCSADFIPRSDLRAELRDKILSEAVPI
jgi:predicted nucleotidyltransferase